jgi:hypothetical protein
LDRLKIEGLEPVGTGLSANFVITKHPQLPTEGILLDLPLDQVIVDEHLSVVVKKNQLGSLSRGVPERLAESA